MNSKNDNYIWIQKKDEVNCCNCLYCKLIPNSIVFKLNSRGKKYAIGKMRCKKGYWLKGDCGEKERFMAYFPIKKWNKSKFLVKMAENCKDFDLMD